jgi:hypothetical protein
MPFSSLIGPETPHRKLQRARQHDADFSAVLGAGAPDRGRLAILLFDSYDAVIDAVCKLGRNLSLSPTLHIDQNAGMADVSQSNNLCIRAVRIELRVWER